MAQPTCCSALARLREDRNDEAGVTAIEYALLIAGIAVAIIGIVFLLGSDIFAMYEGIHEKLEGK